MLLTRTSAPPDNQYAQSVRSRLYRTLTQLDSHLAEHEFLAPKRLQHRRRRERLSLTTMRHFSPIDLTPPTILAYLQRVAIRPAYRRPMDKGDPGVAPLLT